MPVPEKPIPATGPIIECDAANHYFRIMVKFRQKTYFLPVNCQTITCATLLQLLPLGGVGLATQVRPFERLYPIDRKENIRVRTNKMKAKMLAGEPVAGVIISSADEQLVEVLGHAGFDYVMIDCEHGHMSVRECETLVRASEAVGITPVVRVPHNSPDMILRHLDTGAQGIVIPQVNSAADARAAVDAVYYHPIGQRGLAGTRAADYGLTGSLADYTGEANRELAVIALIENIRAVDQMPDILEVEGITAVTIGPADLSQSLGHPGNRHHPEVEAAIDTIISTAVEAGIPVGINTSTGAEAKAARARGCLQTSVSSWGLLAGATRDYLAEAAS